MIVILHSLEADGKVQRESAGGLETWRTNATPQRRKQAGRLDGPVVCLLEIPAIEISTSKTFYGPGNISKVRRYVLHWLTDRDIDGASFAVYATVRHRDKQGADAGCSYGGRMGNRLRRRWRRLEPGGRHYGIEAGPIITSPYHQMAL